MNIPWLEDGDYRFPSTNNALGDPNGLLAAGGDLDPRRLIQAYRQGIFPWYSDEQPILWWTPSPRTVLFPHLIHISKSLRKLLKKNNLAVTSDQDFSSVILECSKPRHTDESGTWITDEMIVAYQQLHEMGFAHSVEVWKEKQLVGGLYGVAIGRAFFGESMFSRVSNASKVALATICQQLAAWDFKLVDCQIESDHLTSMGATNLPRSEFEELLKSCTDTRRTQSTIHPSWLPGKWLLT